MNNSSRLVETINTTTRPILAILDNTYLNAILVIILIVCASLTAPRITINTAILLQHPAMKLLVFFLIAYLSTNRNAGVSLISAAIVLGIFMLFESLSKREHMSNLGTMEANLDKCNGWDCGAAIAPPSMLQDNVEGNESELTESGAPVDFGMSAPVVPVSMDTIQTIGKDIEVKAEEAKAGIVESSMTGIKNLLKSANIIEGFEDSDSSCYSDVDF